LEREGYIVFMSSTLGLVGLPIQSAYNIAKFGQGNAQQERRA
jgi:NAD(P)-dependent dehydrogenase (short-subunit alcohol dehydrogenase family)